jgi:hypothetical protein
MKSINPTLSQFHRSLFQLTYSLMEAEHAFRLFAKKISKVNRINEREKQL